MNIILSIVATLIGIYIVVMGFITWFANASISFWSDDWFIFILQIIFIELLVPWYGIVALFQLVF